MSKAYCGSLRRWLAAAAVIALQPALTGAQPSSPPAQPDARPQTRPDPLRADASVPPLNYRSPIEGYRGRPDEPVAPWRASNDQVREIGGWRTYAREPAAEPSRPSDSHRH